MRTWGHEDLRTSVNKHGDRPRNKDRGTSLDMETSSTWDKPEGDLDVKNVSKLPLSLCVCGWLCLCQCVRTDACCVLVPGTEDSVCPVSGSCGRCCPHKVLHAVRKKARRGFESVFALVGCSVSCWLWVKCDFCAPCVIIKLASVPRLWIRVSKSSI